MKKILLFLSLLFGTFSQIYAQQSSLYFPREIQSAIKNSTRTAVGLPGTNYWQNKSEYTIEAELIPDSSLLKGNVSIAYYNNSPDELTTIWVRLYQNIFTQGAVRDWKMPAQALDEGMKISDLKLNGAKYDISDTETIQFSSTNMIIKLREPLSSKGKIVIEMNWSYTIQRMMKIRMGNYGEGEFFVAYWYPQISVYDDIDGWDKLDYTGTVEFYNDFNDYNFEITLPGNYVVWATGELQNADQVLNPEIIERINNAKKSDETVRIISPNDYKNKKVTINNTMNTWKFSAVNVPDVTFCVSDNYNWDASSIEVEPGRRVLANVVYENGTPHYSEAASYSRATIDYMTNILPGYPYKYPQITTFCNKSRSGGMESPMMANDGAPEILGRHVGLIFHEIAHNYFPFMMGTNERKYAWMDEGWASFFPAETVEKISGDYDSYPMRVKGFEENSGKEAELPPMVLSYSNKGQYRVSAYDRPAVAYNELHELLGRDIFKKALLEYINRWIDKHPIPYDFFFTFNDAAREDLSWFWKPWFFDFGYPDLAIEKVEKENDGYRITINKIGHLPTQLLLTLKFEDGSEDTITKSSRVWKDEKDRFTIKYESDKKLSGIVLGNSRIPDVDRSNNYYLLKK